MSNPLSPPVTPQHNFRRIAILFAGGPAPAANAVISTCAASFLHAGVEVLGLLNGYSRLIDFKPERPLEAGRDYMVLDQRALERTRNSQGILIGTARTNPGKKVEHPSHLTDPERSAPLRRVYEALCSLNVDALISIGGDDTLKTANKLKRFQDALPAGSRRIPVVHLPKTIDNDYLGIDFTFGFFTAVEFLAGEIRNLLYDAEASRSYFIAETMGRSAGWLAYGAAIAGEASLVVSVEDIVGEYRGEETYTDPETGKAKTKPIMKADRLIDRIVRTMVARDRDGKQFGVIVLAEGLAEYLSAEMLKDIPATNMATSRSPKSTSARCAPSWWQRPTKADWQRAQNNGTATGLRVALCQAPGLRRHARQPTGRRRVPGTCRREEGRRDGLHHGATRIALRALRDARRPRHVGHQSPLNRHQQRLPSPGPLPGDHGQGIARISQVTGIGSNGRLSKVPFPVCHGLERDGATIHAALTTVPSRAEVWVEPLPKRADAWLTRLAAVVARSDW